MEKILDPKFLPYLIFTICYAGFIALFLREKVLRKVLELKIPTWVGKVVTSVSITLLILSLLDEIGLFLNEWYFYPKVFSMLRSIMGLPEVSYLVYFANFALLIPFFYQITEKNRQKSDNVEKEALLKLANINFSIDLLTTSFLLTSVQLCAAYADIQNLQWTLLPLLLILCQVVIKAMNSQIQKRITKTIDKNQDRYGNITALLLYGLVFLQTMITKAGLLLAIYYWFRKIFGKITQFSQRRKRNRAISPVFLESLAIHLNPTDWKDLTPLIILFGSILSVIFFWQVNQSPFPPSGGFFPKDTTINLLYTLDILFFLIAIIASRAEWFLTLFATAFLVFTRYGTITLFQNWYVSGSTTLHGPNTVEIIATFFGHNLENAAWFGFILHLLMVIILVSLASANKYYIESILDKNPNRIKSYFISQISINWVIVLLGLFAQTMLYYFFRNSNVSGITFLIFVFSGYFFLLALLSFIIFPDWTGEQSTIKQFFGNIKKFYGDDFLRRINKKISLIKHYSPEKTKGLVKLTYFPFYTLVLSTLFFMIITFFYFYSR